MTVKPVVSVILPSWNAAAFIHRPLTSLDAQTYDLLEILVGDDASSDETPDILRDWAASRPHVRLILRDKNLGWVENCNNLMAQARGQLMFFLGHDDEVDPDFVATLVEALEANPDAILAFGIMRWIEADGTVTLRDGRKTGSHPNTLKRAMRMITGGGQWYVPHHGLFRASACARIGGLKKHKAGEFSSDFPWILHMLLLGRFVFVGRPLCTKWMQGGNLSRAWTWNDAAHIARDTAAIREIRASDLPIWQKLWLGLLVRMQRRGRR